MTQKIFYVSILLLIFTNSSAQKIPEFKAVFNIKYIGFNLGKVYQNFSCEQNNCSLTSIAEPKGIIRNFVNESAVETIKITQTDKQFLWQSYNKILHRRKGGKTIIKHTDLVREHNQIKYLQASPTQNKITMPARNKIYDIISIIYAIQFNVLNKQPLNKLFIQDEKGQYPLTLIKEETDYIDLPWFYEEQEATYLSLNSDIAKIKVWLLPALSSFPVSVKIYNVETDRTLVLTLSKPPKKS